MAVGLELPDQDYFLNYHNGHNNQLRLLHYPPVPASDLETNKSARMPAHTDWGSFTMLFQDECGGLQVEDPYQEGRFMEATPMKGALVMNVGDLMMRWSNGMHVFLRCLTTHAHAPPSYQALFGAQDKMLT